MFSENLHDIVTVVTNTQGNNKKVETLHTLVDDSANKLEIVSFFKILLEKKNYGVKKLELQEPGALALSYERMLEIIDSLTNKYTGNKRLEYLKTELSKLNEKSQTILYWLIECKKTPMLLGDVLISKALGLEKTKSKANSYMRCSLPTDKIIKKFNFSNAIVQPKLDGSYVEIGFLPDGNFGARTRAGKLYPNDVFNLDQDKFEYLLGQCYFIGELLVENSGVTQPREIGNGVLNHLQKKGGKVQEDIVFYCWDVLDANWENISKPYGLRFAESRELLPKVLECSESLKVKPVDYQRVMSYEL